MSVYFEVELTLARFDARNKPVVYTSLSLNLPREPEETYSYKSTTETIKSIINSHLQSRPLGVPKFDTTTTSTTPSCIMSELDVDDVAEEEPDRFIIFLILELKEAKGPAVLSVCPQDLLPAPSIFIF